MIKKYLNFIDILLKKLVAILHKFFNINWYIINLKLNKQLSYKPLYSLELIKLKFLKLILKPIWPKNLTNF